MPVIQSAIKKLRKDKVRTVLNKAKGANLKALIKRVRQQKTPENLRAVFQALDKAAKTHFIHENKAARLKSRLSKGISIQAAKPKRKSKKSKQLRVIKKTKRR